MSFCTLKNINRLYLEEYLAFLLFILYPGVQRMYSYDLIREEAKKSEMQKNLRLKKTNFFLGFLSILVFLSVWQLAVMFSWVNTKFLESPFDVLKLLVLKTYTKTPDGALLQQHILSSLSVVLSGFFLATIIGIPLGLLMGWNRLFERFIRPVFEIIRPIPTIAWIPIVVLFLGIGIRAKALIIFFSAFIAIVINSYTGIQMTNKVLINVAKTCGASNFRIFLKVGIPSSLPMVFAGMRIAIGTSWGAVVAAEMLAASRGLGFMISLGRTYMRVDLIIGGIVVIGILGMLFTAIFSYIEDKFLKWRSR